MKERGEGEKAGSGDGGLKMEEKEGDWREGGKGMDEMMREEVRK